MQIQDKIGGILYDRGGKPGSNYLDLERGSEFWNRVAGSDYKSLVHTICVVSLSVCWWSVVHLLTASPHCTHWIATAVKETIVC